MNACIETPCLLLRPFRKSDHADLYEFLAQLEDDEFEGYLGITFENSRAQLDARIGSDEFLAMERKDSGKVIGNIYRGRRDFEAIEVGYIVGADSGGKHASGRTAFSTGMQTGSRSGRIRTSTHG